MKKHYSRIHNSNTRYPFTCNDCNRGFPRKWQLQQHSYQHTGEAPFSCNKCDARFLTARELNKHRRNHKTYICVCGDVFHRWTLLLDHRRLCERLSKFVLCRFLGLDFIIFLEYFIRRSVVLFHVKVLFVLLNSCLQNLHAIYARKYLQPDHL